MGAQAKRDVVWRMTVYHGTDVNFETFDAAKMGSTNGTAPINMAGFNFSDSEAVALTFGMTIVAAEVSFCCPLIIDAKGGSYSEFKHTINDRLERALGKDYDCVVIRNYLDAGLHCDDLEELQTSTHYIPRSVEQIRVVSISLKDRYSAINNM